MNGALLVYEKVKLNETFKSRSFKVTKENKKKLMNQKIKKYNLQVLELLFFKKKKKEKTRFNQSSG